VDIGKNVSVLDVCVLSEILVCVTHCAYHLLPQQCSGKVSTILDQECSIYTEWGECN